MNDYLESMPDDYDAGQAEERANSGGMMPPGFYHARLDGVAEKEAKSGNVGVELAFTVTSGPFTGATVSDTLWRPDKQFTADRFVRFGSRLGLFQCDAKGHAVIKDKRPVPVEGKTDFKDCLDKEVIIEVFHEPDKDNPSKHWLRVKPMGIYHANDPEAKAKVGKPVEKKPAAGSEKKAAAGEKKDDAKPPANGKKRVDRGEL